MDQTSGALLSAFSFTWLGLVIGISFIEAPLKFRAPGVTIPLGLGIGRLVFRALNVVECVLAAGLVVAVAVGGFATPASVLVIAVLVLLAIQLAVVRPRLNRRTDRVLSAPDGAELPRSRAHLAYVGAEVLKVAALVALGIAAR
ncbi:hypothetical protein [Amycolatopsis eburnea]|uniref:Transmembrane protein n=1 Tax=Amycolatopsis eburnea TaxID=2267691 RepID=A0A3R9FIK5_9PSEU|nr:hypothetical protein [Amycolatopsis eburnea]RSD11798.1 hypothetical protein EIY87_34155 [Amycolatopsis eburnea]